MRAQSYRNRGLDKQYLRLKVSASGPAEAFATLEDSSRFRGGNSKEPGSSLPIDLPIDSIRFHAHTLLWTIPLNALVLSFLSFGGISRRIFRAIQFCNWLPSTPTQIDLQTNVVTQVVNGPVITSVSVLFASLVSMTISTLHERLVVIQRSLVWEIHQLRLLQSLLASQAARVGLSDQQLSEISALVQQYSDALFSSKYSSSTERSDPQLYIESTLPALLDWCHDILGEYRGKKSRSRNERSPEPLIAEIQTLTHGMLQERGNRWMALIAVRFPFVHYMVLALLAVSICVAFLVSTAQAEVLFREEGVLSVRVLWSVLITTFAALGVLCYDLANPFMGAYLVAEANKSGRKQRYIHVKSSSHS